MSLFVFDIHCDISTSRGIRGRSGQDKVSIIYCRLCSISRCWTLHHVIV